MHLLQSLVVFADIGDILSFTSNSHANNTLAITGEYSNLLLDGCEKQNNLILKAYKLLKNYFPEISNDIAIELVKNLPIGAGIGGGSADAAACLRGILKINNINIKSDIIFSIAEKLGADVPVCLNSSTSLISGIGEHVDSLPNIKEIITKTPIFILLVNPGEFISTKDVFAKLNSTKRINNNLEILSSSLQKLENINNFILYLQKCRNDLEAVATTLKPVVIEVIDSLKASRDCLLARMSGSGSTCFGLYTDRDAATEAAIAISSSHRNWWLKVATVRDYNFLYS